LTVRFDRQEDATFLIIFETNRIRVLFKQADFVT